MRWEFDSAAIEFRSLQEYTNKDGKVTITIIVEDEQANQNRIRCNDSTRLASSQLIKALPSQLPSRTTMGKL